MTRRSPIFGGTSASHAFRMGIGLFAAVGFILRTEAAAPPAPPLFARDNLVAWCIVPFDAKKRTPEERAAMLKRLGFRRYAYDWRAEHLPTFERELTALQKNGIELTAVWFPAALNADARTLLDALKKHGIKTQLWATMNGGTPTADAAEQKKRVESHAAAIRPIAEAAAKIGCTVALYNHGGWFGEPENQLAVIQALQLPNVGIVYNLHHGHDHLARFPDLLKKMKPHLLALNLNGMVKGGDRAGKQILPLGQGDLDLSLLKAIAASGWRGPVGILGHTNDDVEDRLKDNLDGLDWLVPQLAGKPAGPKPRPRTMPAAPKPTAGWLAAGKAEYCTPPLTVECRVKLAGKRGYNILVACDTKASAAHWELFAMPGSGHLTAYLPGLKPDHVRSQADIADGKWHVVAMHYEPGRVRLFADGKKVAEQDVAKAKPGAVPGGLGFARLVEGGLGCDGELGWVRLSKGTVAPAAKEPAADDATIGLWKFAAPDLPATDVSPLKNPAKVAAAPATTPQSPAPPPGVHLRPAGGKGKAVLIDRSADDAYMAVKADGAGRLFVGGREAVFVFEPDGRGGFNPRREFLRFPPDSIVIGLEYRGDDLYVLTGSALYLVPGGRTRRDGLTPKRLLWGLPLDLHVSFHCLAWGPQGDLYLDHGDPLLNYGDWARPDHWGHWTLYSQPTGTKVPYTGTGAVLRVRPDGTGLRVVAGGLRGPVGLAFDRNWELFTNDNDHESRPDLYTPARLLHVTPHADFAWPRGWMASKTPNRADLLEPVNSAMGRGVPCDLAYYDEPLFPELRGNLLLCRWDRMSVSRFPLRPRGATYAAEELTAVTGEHLARPTGITVDRGGRVFVTCHYLGGNVVSPHCVSDLIAITRDEAPAVEASDETKAPVERLWASLSGPSAEGRRRAHTELLRRGGDGLKEAVRRFDALGDGDPAQVHLPWLAAVGGGKETTDFLVRLARKHSRPEVRLQAVRALAEYPSLGAPLELFADALADASPPVQLAALARFFDTGRPPVDAVARFAAGTDPYLRQTAAMLLARRAKVSDLERLAKAPDAPTRLAAVLAAGLRLTVPPVHEAPPKEVALHYPAGNPFFHRKLRFADAAEAVDLADLGPVGSYTTAQRWKALKPTAEQARLFDLLRHGLDDPSAPVKSQAACYLGLLRDPRSEPGVERVRQELAGGALTKLPPVSIRSAWLAGPFPDGGRGPATEHPPQRGPIDLTAQYPVAAGKAGWRKAEDAAGRFAWTATGDTSTYAYFRVSSRSRQPALLTATAAGAVRLWHNGRPVDAPAAPGPVLLDLQPGSNDLLVRAAGSGPLTLAVRAKERVSAEVPEKRDGALLAARLKEAGAAKVGPEFLAVDWAKEARKGDAERGRKLFGSLGCAKCHAIAADQAGGGAPSLADVGKRFAPAYLVESILTPDQQVAEEFRSTRVATADGRVLSGLVVRETAAEIELLLPDTTRAVLKTADIEQRTVSLRSPMPAGLVRTPAELRDLLTYLLGNRPAPP